jgi:hypothetical protein
MGSQKRGIVGKSQSVLIMINHIIFTRTRRLGHTQRKRDRGRTRTQSTVLDVRLSAGEESCGGDQISCSSCSSRRRDAELVRGVLCGGALRTSPCRPNATCDGDATTLRRLLLRRRRLLLLVGLPSLLAEDDLGCLRRLAWHGAGQAHSDMCSE